MADIRAFRGFRFDLAQAGPLADLIAPPYDVIDEALQQRLYARSPYNAVRVELTAADPGDRGPEDRYIRAAQHMRDWLDRGVLRQDSSRSLYVLEQQFTVEGTTYTRRGFFARVRLEPFGTGRIFPHEQTFSGPKKDRLALYRATGFNLSPIFGLYPDAGEATAVLEPHVRRSPPLEAVDHLGTINRLWAIADPAAITAVTGLMGPRPIFIADGHHRYETGLQYWQESGMTDPDSPAAFCLMLLVSMSDPGLIIQPTHRLLAGLGPITSDQLQAKLAEHFDIIERCPSASACWETLLLEGSQQVLGFGTGADGRWFAARLRNAAIMDRLAPEHSPAWCGLGVSIVQELLLKEILQHQAHCRYVHQVSEAQAALNDRTCDVACLVPAASMEDVQAVAGNHETMPPKSTYFFPKVPTGLVFNSLRKD